VLFFDRVSATTLRAARGKALKEDSPDASLGVREVAVSATNRASFTTGSVPHSCPVVT
jgi:hypothetical protein